MRYSLYDADIDIYCPPASPKTLGDWVKNFRVKKLQMKRRLRASNSNLRVSAILSTALLSAENQLRLKQQERLNRCLQLQSKFTEKLSGTQFQQQLHQQQQHQHDKDASSDDNAAIVATNSKIVEEAELKRRIEISNLWREELNGLDNLLRKTSSTSGSSSSSANAYGSGNCSGSCAAEAASHQYGESDQTTNVLKSIAVLS